MSKRRVKQCPCGQWFEGWGKLCETCRKPKAGISKHPLYNTWSVNLNKKWKDFSDFLREVGNPPSPSHILSPIIPGTPIGPGNVVWKEVDRLEDLKLNELTPFNEMLDPEMRRLAAQSYIENTEEPVGKIRMLRELEKQAAAKAKPDDLEAWQLEIEQESQDYSIALKRDADAKQVEAGRGAQVRVGRSLRRKLLPGLALRLKEMHTSALRQNAGRHHKIVRPLLEKLQTEDGLVDYELVAHITLSCVLNAVGRGSRMSTPMVKVLDDIGMRLDHQAFLEYVKASQPQAWNKIDRWVLKNEETGYGHKIKKAVGLTDEPYAFQTKEQNVKVGEWCFNAMQSITDWFDTIRWYTGKKKRFQYYLGLSEEGLKQIDLIQTAVDELAFEAWPMVTKPLRWSDEQRGGYLKFHPGTSCDLVHRDRGTKASPTALEALHRAQEVPFKINRFIYETQINLLSRSEEIGSFRTYEKDSWEDVNRPRIHPDVWDNKYDENDNISKEYRDAIVMLKKFYAEQKKSEKQYSKVPFRVLKVAARFLDVERFYLPCYFDTRLRLYYTVDTVTPNGADYQKALLLAADGKKITDSNRDAIERDLLITLANTWANSENGVKTDKMPYEQRVAFARQFLKELEIVARDPLTTSARCLWTAADEPFQFLSVVRELYECFIWKTKDTTNVFNGRDATNSGMQILGAISKDEKACYYTNVIPSDEPQDLYGEVAKEAQALLNSDVWVSRKITKYIKETQKKMDEREKKKQVFQPPDFSSFVLGMDPGRVDRSILKKAVMCTSYGASWGSKNEYISEGIEDAFDGDSYDPTLTDKRLVTDASIEGQTAAFPQCDILNKWFRDFGKACMDAGKELVKWTTPNGSTIVQEYREPKIKQVKTHAMGGGSYYSVEEKKSKDGVVSYSVQTGWGEVKENKAATALGANWTHSLDACLLQDTIAVWDRPFYTVHDCFYGLAGDMDDLCDKARAAFKKVIEEDPMQRLVSDNEIEIDLPPMGQADISQCLNAPYMFC